MVREDVINAANVRAHLGLDGTAAAVPVEADFEGALEHWLGEAAPRPGELYHAALAAFERPLFEHALRETGGNQLQASRLLGINRNTLRKRLGELGIDADRFHRRA
jgi:two-component system nitrogen regulation response regulator GlnG